MNAEQLQAIKERAEKAFPAPWYANSENEILVENDGRLGKVIRGYDAEFIAHAREDIPVLIAEVERLQKEKEALEFQLKMSINHAETVAEELETESKENERLRVALEYIADHNIFTVPQIVIKASALKALAGDSND